MLTGILPSLLYVIKPGVVYEWEHTMSKETTLFRENIVVFADPVLRHSAFLELDDSKTRKGDLQMSCHCRLQRLHQRLVG